MNGARSARALGLWLGCALLSLVAFALLVSVPQPKLHGIETFDLTHYFQPTAEFLHAQLRAGRFPLWNPYQLAGEPFAGLQAPGLFYPIGIALAWLFPPERILEAHFVVHLTIASATTWLLLARLGLGIAARATGAVAFALSAPMLFAGLYMIAFQSTQAWLPAILLSIHGVASERRVGWAVALAAFLALAFAGGHAQAFVYEVELGAAFGVYCLFSRVGRGQRLRAVGLAALAGGLALLLVAPALWAALELVPRAVRSFDGLTYAQVARGHAQPLDLLRGLVGLPIEQRPMVFTGLRQWLTAQPFAFIPLAVAGFAVRGRRGAWLFWSAGALLTAALMLGPATPLFALYFETPTGSWFRIPTRLAFVYALCSAVSMALGVDALTRWIGARGGRARAVATVVGLGIAATTAWNLIGRVDLFYSHPSVYARDRAKHAELAAFLRARRDRPRVFVEEPQVPNRIPLLYKIGMTNGVFAVPDYEPAVPADYARAFGAPASPPWHGHLSVAAEAAAPASRRAERLGRVLDLMGVRFYATPADAPEATQRALAAFSGDPDGRVFGALRVYERASAQPRAYAVGRVIAAADQIDALRTVARADFDPARDAAVEPDTTGATEAMAGLTQRFDPASAPVAITEYAASRVRIEAACAERCLLVLSDLHYPGWTATVDGEPRAILRANGLFRGVALDAGRSQVEFRYRPAWLRVGGPLCAAGSLACAALLLAPRARRGVR